MTRTICSTIPMTAKAAARVSGKAGQAITLSAVGFNPFRKHDKSTLDIALVVGFVALTLAFVAWGFFG